MKRIPLILLPLTAYLICLSQNSHAWNAGGHRIVNFIAWTQLKPETRQAAVTLIKKHKRFNADFLNYSHMPNSVKNGSSQIQDHWFFLQAAVWPDVIRSGDGREEFHRGRWHYVNFPYFIRESDKSMDLSRVNLSTKLPRPLTKDNQQTLNVIQAIHLSERVLRNKSSSIQAKSTHLMWLMHLVGDIHQPAHSTALFTSGVFKKGDRGANLLKTGKTNLHSTWDGLLGRPSTVGNIGSRASAMLAQYQQLGPAAMTALAPYEWAQESHILAKHLLYTPTIIAAVRAQDNTDNDSVMIELPEDYKMHAAKAAQQRIVQAGYRLAVMIERLLGK